MPRKKSIAMTTTAPSFSSHFQLPTLKYCFDILGLGSRKQKVVMHPLVNSNGEIRSMRCYPSLHSKDCQEVAHDCWLWETCFQSFQDDFKSLNDKNFDCGQMRGNKFYYQPQILPTMVFTQLVMIPVNYSVLTHLQYLTNSICSSSYPNIDFFIKQNIVYCKEKIVTPDSECWSFLQKCEDFLKCYLEHKIECMPKQLVAIPDLRPACQHWSFSPFVVSKLDTRVGLQGNRFRRSR